MGSGKKITVRGMVQGVGFRYWAKHMASELELDGYVMNKPDGSVELLIAGSYDSVERMTELCGTGPRSARVTAIKIEDSMEPVSSGFCVRF